MRTRHYAFTITNERPRQMGGCNYTVNVFYLDPQKGPVRIGGHDACTAAHKGEMPEAWTHIRPHLPPRYRKHHQDVQYATW